MADRYKHKPGAQKLGEKRRREMEAAGKDPKQAKLTFWTGNVNVVVNEPESVSGEASETGNMEAVVNEPESVSGEASETGDMDAVVNEPESVSGEASETGNMEAVVNEPESVSGEASETGNMEAVVNEAESVSGEASGTGTVVNEIESEVYVIPAFVAPNERASISEKLVFMGLHPIQPTGVTEFSDKRVYSRCLPNGETVGRKWLSYSTAVAKIFCSVCMAFSKEITSFSTGLICDKRHLYNRLEKHETCKAHKNACEAYLHADSNNTVDELVDKAREGEKRSRRLVLERIIDIIHFIAKNNLAYRGKDEAAWQLSLEDLEDVNCGNFLGLVLLLSKYDPLLKQHVQDVIERSKRLKEGKAGNSRGRGSLVTLLSKTTVNKLLIIMGQLIKEKIVEEIREAGKYGIEVDSTQDVGVVDQLAICLRYVKSGEVYERLVTICDSRSGTGAGLHNRITQELESIGLRIEDIIGQSYDGASNMVGKYVGLQTLIKTKAPKSIFTHCYAHRFNLLMTDTTTCCLEAKKLFGLIQETAVFIKDSYKRMNVWKEVQEVYGKGKVRRLQLVGNTRWTSKDKALENIIGTYSALIPERLVLLLRVLDQITKSDDFDSKVTFQASSLKANWLKFETILMALVCSRIFQHSTPVSKYLQTSGLDMLVAFSMIKKVTKKLDAIREEYDDIVDNAQGFGQACNILLEDAEMEDSLQTTFEVKRISKKKKMTSGETADQARQELSSPSRLFQVSTFNVVIDKVCQTIRRRFDDNESIITDISYLHPQCYDQWEKEGLPDGSMDALAYLSGVNAELIRTELVDFAIHFKGIALRENTPQVLDADVNDEENCGTTGGTCRQCLGCVLKILYKYNLHCSTFSNLYICVKTALCLPCTQVKCERVFSKLKLVKTRIRSLLGQDNLDALLLLNVERDIHIPYDVIINTFALSSKELTNFLF